MSETRTCKVCGEVQPIDSYGFNGVNQKDGKKYRRDDCRTCQAIAQRERYRTDPQARALQVMYSMEASVKRKFPEAWSGSLVKQGAARLLAASRCAYCEMPNDGSLPFSLDHHVPLALGGAHSLENLRPCCEPCNRAKHDMPPEVFQAWMAALVSRLAWLRAQ